MSNIVGTYIKAKVDLPIYVVPLATGDFFQIPGDAGILKAGATYPFLVNRVFNAGGKNFAIFKVSNNPYLISIGANETWIPLTDLDNQVQSVPNQSGYVEPQKESVMDQVKKYGGRVLLGLGVVYLAGKYLGGGR